MRLSTARILLILRVSRASRPVFRAGIVAQTSALGSTRTRRWRCGRAGGVRGGDGRGRGRGAAGMCVCGNGFVSRSVLGWIRSGFACDVRFLKGVRRVRARDPSGIRDRQHGAYRQHGAPNK